MTEDEIRQLIRDELRNFIKTDKFDFKNDLEIRDKRNVIVSTVTGTKYGTSILQKQGWWDATPVVQSQGTGASGYAAIGGTNVNSDDTWTGGVGSNIYSIGDIVRVLKLVGFIKS